MQSWIDAEDSLELWQIIFRLKKAPTDLHCHLVLILQITSLILYCYYINGFSWFINTENGDIVINQ